jgi:hypothetical protein
MLKKLAAGLALMGCALSSHAEVQGFDWSFSGFVPHWSSEMDPAGYDGPFNLNTTLTGRFFAEDRDQDGSFSRSEVISFSVGNQSMLNCTGQQRCALSSFSFTPGSVLSFDAYNSSEYGKYGSGWSRTTHSYTTGNRFYTMWENDWSQSGASGSVEKFTSETRFAISAVPEPQTWLMLGAGIALLGVVKRRRAGK